MPTSRPPAPLPGEDVPHRLAPGETFDIRAHDTDDCGRYASREESEERVADLMERLVDLHGRFAAEASRALLVVLQGFDGAGKDSVITHVMTACDPAGLHVFSFNTPVGDESEHDFLWRFHQQAPKHGMVHVFDRSYYEEVISARVHGIVDDEAVDARCDSINDLERILSREGTVILKFFLHMSKDVQAERVEERLRTPSKQHEFSAADVEDRELWEDYDRAYEHAIRATSTEIAPWHVVPADHRWYVRAAVAEALVRTLEALDPQYPPLDEDDLEEAGIDRSAVGA